MARLLVSVREYSTLQRLQTNRVEVTRSDAEKCHGLRTLARSVGLAIDLQLPPTAARKGRSRRRRCGFDTVHVCELLIDAPQEGGAILEGRILGGAEDHVHHDET